MTRKEAIERIKIILEECIEDEDAVSYVTSYDADALDMAIKALKQEPCEDCISRQAAIDALAKFVPYAICDESTESYTNGLTDAYNLICQLPSAQPEPQWIPCSERLPEEKDAGILKKLGTEKKVRVCSRYSRGQGRKNDRDSLYV